jgi:hypothetical protein
LFSFNNNINDNQKQTKRKILKLEIFSFFNLKKKKESKVGVKTAYGAYPPLMAPQIVTPLPPSGNIHYCEKKICFNLFLLYIHKYII